MNGMVLPSSSRVIVRATCPLFRSNSRPSVSASSDKGRVSMGAASCGSAPSVRGSWIVKKRFLPSVLSTSASFCIGQFFRVVGRISYLCAMDNFPGRLLLLGPPRLTPPAQESAQESAAHRTGQADQHQDDKPPIALLLRRGDRGICKDMGNNRMHGLAHRLARIDDHAPSLRIADNPLQTGQRLNEHPDGQNDPVENRADNACPKASAQRARKRTAPARRKEARQQIKEQSLEQTEVKEHILLQEEQKKRRERALQQTPHAALAERTGQGTLNCTHRNIWRAQGPSSRRRNRRPGTPDGQRHHRDKLPARYRLVRPTARRRRRTPPITHPAMNGLMKLHLALLRRRRRRRRDRLRRPFGMRAGPLVGGLGNRWVGIASKARIAQRTRKLLHARVTTLRIDRQRLE